TKFLIKLSLKVYQQLCIAYHSPRYSVGVRSFNIFSHSVWQCVQRV
uniref:Telomerase reverse transcriptase n=1 Tax=Anopheles coluzzii TaxID=1518534 RepID=A0A6E8VXB4_ANOCL